MLRAFVNCAMVLKKRLNARLCKLRNGVKKTPQFLLFSMAKGGPSAQ
jgi:hypothetical protein